MNSTAIDKLGFEILEVVDETDQTIAWKALQRNLDRIVILRMLKPEVAHTTLAVDNFLNIARVVARVKSVSVLSIFDIVSTQDLHYVVTESVDGPVLRELMAEKGALPVKTAVQIALALAGSLDDLWRTEKLVYRNLSCHTIKLTPRGVPKLVDFSWAQVATADGAARHDDEEHVVDDPCFLAPEQIEGLAVPIPQSDMYAMGVLLYYLITGVIPFGDLEFEAVIEAHLSGEVPPPHQLNPKVYLSLSRLIQRLMAKSPENRPRGWQAVIQELSQHLGETVPPDTPSLNDIPSSIASFVAEEPAPAVAAKTGMPRLKIPSSQKRRGVASKSVIEQHQRELERHTYQRQLLWWLLLLVWFAGLFWYRSGQHNAGSTAGSRGIGRPDNVPVHREPEPAAEPPPVMDTTPQPVEPETVATPSPIEPEPPPVLQAGIPPELVQAMAAAMVRNGAQEALEVVQQAEHEFAEREELLQILQRVPTLERLVARHMQGQLGKAMVFERDGKQRIVVPQSATAEAIVVEANNRKIEIALSELTVDEKLRWISPPRNEAQRLTVALALLNSTRSAEFDDLAARCTLLKPVLSEVARLKRRRNDRSN